MSQVMEVPVTRFGRRQTRGVLLGFSGPRVAALGSAAVLLGLALYSGVVAVAIVPVTVLVAVSFVPWQGRPVVESVGTVAHWGARVGLRQTRFRVRVSIPRPVGSMALPGDASALRFYVSPTDPHGAGPAAAGAGASGVVMVHDPHAQTLTAVAEVSYRAFVLLDGHAQHRRVSAWGRVLATQGALARTSTIQVLESVIPDPGRGVVGWWESHGVHDDSWASVEYGRLMDLYAPASSTHRTLIAVGLDMKRAKGQIRRAGRGVAGAAAVLGTDIAQIEHALRRAELSVESWLSEDELARVVRGTYDPVTDLAPGAPGANLGVAGPMAIDEHWDHLVHDSGVSMVLWISDWPRTETIPNFMHQLIFERGDGRGIRRTLSLFMRPIPQHAAVREVRSEKTNYVADRAQKEKMGQVLAESDADEYHDVVARERALNAGHADMRYTGLITVTGATVEDTRAACDTLRRSANACGMETEILYGRQAQAFTAAALPLGRVVA